MRAHALMGRQVQHRPARQSGSQGCRRSQGTFQTQPHLRSATWRSHTGRADRPACGGAASPSRAPRLQSWAEGGTPGLPPPPRVDLSAARAAACRRRRYQPSATTRLATDIAARPASIQSGSAMVTPEYRLATCGPQAENSHRPTPYDHASLTRARMLKWILRLRSEFRLSHPPYRGSLCVHPSGSARRCNGITTSRSAAPRPLCPCGDTWLASCVGGAPV